MSERLLLRDKKGRGDFRSVSLPSQLVDEAEKVVAEYRYWPTKTDFVREAVVEKLKTYQYMKHQITSLQEGRW